MLDQILSGVFQAVGLHASRICFFCLFHRLFLIFGVISSSIGIRLTMRNSYVLGKAEGLKVECFVGTGTECQVAYFVAKDNHIYPSIQKAGLKAHLK